MKHRFRNPRAGVTLIEMLVVVVIIAVFAAVVGPRLLNQGDKARVVAAKQQIENFQLALGQYHLDTGVYPTTEQGLRRCACSRAAWISGMDRTCRKTSRRDPWGHPYVYKYPGRSWRRAGCDLLWRRRPAGRHGFERRYRQLEVDSWNESRATAIRRHADRDADRRDDHRIDRGRVVPCPDRRAWAACGCHRHRVPRPVF